MHTSRSTLPESMCAADHFLIFPSCSAYLAVTGRLETMLKLLMKQSGTWRRRRLATPQLHPTMRKLQPCPEQVQLLLAEVPPLLLLHLMGVWHQAHVEAGKGRADL
ncbi:hypothetical protein Tsubulata_005081, partial [Turnera subulata]